MAFDPTPASPRPEEDAGARPKVLRRPAQFSQRHTSPAPTGPEIRIAPAAPAISNLPALRSAVLPWQEDGRFGMALIFVVALINVLLGIGLPLVKHPATTIRPATILSDHPTMPAAMKSTEPSGVSVYSEQHERAATDRMDINALPETYNAFETDPQEIPAPTARALNSTEE